MGIAEQLARAAAEARAAEIGYKRARAAYTEAVDYTADAETAQKVVQAAAQAVQQQAHARIAGVVSRCLTAVFDEPYLFDIGFEQRRGRTEAALRFIRDGNSLDPMRAAGGGPVDVAAFALRLASLTLAKPPARPFLALDEPFRFLSREYRPRVAVLLQALAAELGVQLLMVTHMPELAEGATIHTL